MSTGSNEPGCSSAFGRLVHDTGKLTLPVSPRRRPPQYDLPHAAPGQLRLVQLLLNSRDAEYGNEWIGTPKDLAAWLDERGLHVARVSGDDVKRVQVVREALRELTIANNERTPVPEAASPSISFRRP